MSTTYFAINRWNKTACRIDAASWEQVQTMFRIGIQMPDGDLATGIGRCKSGEFIARAGRGGFRVCSYESVPTAA